MTLVRTRQLILMVVYHKAVRSLLKSEFEFDKSGKHPIAQTSIPTDSLTGNDAQK